MERCGALSPKGIDLDDKLSVIRFVMESFFVSVKYLQSAWRIAIDGSIKVPAALGFILFGKISMNEGTIVSVRGIVVDMFFESNPPKVYDAVEVSMENAAGNKVTIEVQQQLEDGVVRGVAMDSTDGLMR